MSTATIDTKNTDGALKHSNTLFTFCLSLYILGSVLSHMSYLQAIARYSLVIFAALTTSILFLIDNQYRIAKRDIFLLTILILPQILFLPFYGDVIFAFYLYSFFVNYIVLLAFSRYPISEKAWVLLFFVILVLSSFPIFENQNLISLFSNSNVLSIILIFELLILFYFKKAFNKYLYYSLLVFLILLTYLTHSRSSLIFLAVFFILLLLNKVLNVRSMKLIGVLIFVVITLIYINLIFYGGNFFLELFAGVSHKGSALSHRDVIARAALDYVQNNFLGLGFGESNLYLQETIGKNLTPHNTFLKMLMEGGYIYFIANIFIYTYFFFQTRDKLIIAFVIAYASKLLFESATPLGYSLISFMILLPFFLTKKGLSTKKSRL